MHLSTIPLSLLIYQKQKGFICSPYQIFNRISHMCKTPYYCLCPCFPAVQIHQLLCDRCSKPPLSFFLICDYTLCFKLKHSGKMQIVSQPLLPCSIEKTKVGWAPTETTENEGGPVRSVPAHSCQMVSEICYPQNYLQYLILV